MTQYAYDELTWFDAQCEKEQEMSENTGYWCDGCGTPTPFGSKLCGGAKCFNMAAETGQGWSSDRPVRSPKIPRSPKRTDDESSAELRQGEAPDLFD